MRTHERVAPLAVLKFHTFEVFSTGFIKEEQGHATLGFLRPVARNNRDMSTVAEPGYDLVRQARVAQSLTASWMAIELLVALAAGIAAGSVALTAFGVDSGIEIFTSLVVLRQLLLRTERASEEELDHRERQASRLVGWGLYGLIAYIAVSSAISLLTRSHPESSTVGLVLAVAVLIVMPVLWRWRLSLAGRLDSPALRGDAACSLVCTYMAAVLLAGLALNQAFGWWWADPLAGLAMIWWIRGEAKEALEAAETGRRDD
jgi:divalent metal cation (Fe/Co/Zn/Cd) transporter